MGKEIERKFLIDLDKVGSLENGISIKQGYIPTADHTVVRARVFGDKAVLTLKSKNVGASRLEFEYPIPADDANEIIAKLCAGQTVIKTRYLIKHKNHTWEIDIFAGDNAGLIVAEVELKDENESFEIPAWVIEEVTNDCKYYNSNLLKCPYKNWDKKSR